MSRDACCAPGKHLHYSVWCDLAQNHAGPHSVLIPCNGNTPSFRWFWIGADDVPARSEDTVMRDAWDLTTKDRHNQYGKAEDAFRAYGHIWTGLLAHKLAPGVVIDATDVAIMMTGLKLGREVRASKRDNVVDAHGYLSLLSRIRGWIA